MHNSPKCLLCPRPPPRQDGDLVLLHLEFASFAARWSTSFLGVSIELLSLMVLVLLFMPFFEPSLATRSVFSNLARYMPIAFPVNR